MDQSTLILVWAPPSVLWTLSLFIALHHLYKHSQEPWNSKARQESCPQCCYLQPSDLRNHEVWVVSLFAVGISWVAAAYTFGD